MVDKYDKKRIVKAAKNLNSIIDLSENVAYNIGTIIKYKEYPSNTNIKRVTRDFYGFDFDFEEGESMFGGKDLVISYQGEKVLSLSYQDFGSYGIYAPALGGVPYFDGRVQYYKSGDWEKKLEKLAKNKQQSIRSYMLKNGQSSLDAKVKDVYSSRHGTDIFVKGVKSGKIQDPFLGIAYKELSIYINK